MRIGGGSIKWWLPVVTVVLLLLRRDNPMSIGNVAGPRYHSECRWLAKGHTHINMWYRFELHIFRPLTVWFDEVRLHEIRMSRLFQFLIDGPAWMPLEDLPLSWFVFPTFLEKLNFLSGSLLISVYIFLAYNFLFQLERRFVLVFLEIPLHVHQYSFEKQ